MLTVAGATVAFSTISFAQTAPATTAPADRSATEKGHHGWGKGEGRRGGEGMRGHGMRHGGGMRMMLHGLDLTDAQKTQIQSIMAANKPNDQFREEMKTLRMAQRSGTLTDVQKERLTAIRADRQVKAKAVHEQVLAVLTPEQKAKIEARHAEMQKSMQERKAMHSQGAPATTDKPKN